MEVLASRFLHKAGDGKDRHIFLIGRNILRADPDCKLENDEAVLISRLGRGGMPGDFSIRVCKYFSGALDGFLKDSNLILKSEYRIDSAMNELHIPDVTFASLSHIHPVFSRIKERSMYAGKIREIFQAAEELEAREAALAAADAAVSGYVEGFMIETNAPEVQNAWGTW